MKKCLFLTFCFSLGLISCAAQVIERDSFRVRSLTYDLIILNNTDETLLLEKVGFAYTFDLERNPKKLTDPITLKSEADYQVGIAPGAGEDQRIQAAEPPLQLQAGERLRFTLGTDLHLFDRYYTLIYRKKGILEFSNGVRLETNPEKVVLFDRP